MANADGQWDCVTKTPMGEQKSVFTIVTNGDTFTGSNDGPTGKVDVIDGKIENGVLTWKMKLKMPPMTMDATATVDGDTLNGSVKVGPLGTMTMIGQRRA
ncbi:MULTISPECIES: hypothetical protein [Sphingomonadales]|uniref:Uncharacterized protein n=2 Tax=Edaphosphingomonas TaxID=3423724 RepID=A0A2T4HRX1_9SPHN|nr:MULTISPECIES: hypothetical protein [Sphingomonas]AGH50269.1 hypothetical protein G432_12750 [Sphingomonas sp. MM-1]OHT18609.1 hypothetical protein BHE75_00583 [Sphingomonas haloaromaticamans]PTD18541.1 hypothetical protein CV103_14875 [Sphingomonas fennica]